MLLPNEFAEMIELSGFTQQGMQRDYGKQEQRQAIVEIGFKPLVHQEAQAKRI